MTKKILIIDGYSFLFRAYYAMSKFTRSDGTPVGAVYGFINMVLNLRKKLNCTHLLLTFDTGKKTFRNEIYDKYKAHRPPVPEDLIPQFSLVRRAAESMGILVLEKDGYEADDVIATVAKKAEDKGFKVIIASSDKDLMQLINNNIILYDGMKQKEINEAEVYEKFGVKPKQVLDLLAMTGDKADNVPGIPSIGPKTAAELITKYGTIENILANTHEIKQDKRRKVIEENKDSAILSKKLIELDINVPLKENLDDMELTKIDADKFIPFLEENEFSSIKDRFLKANGNVDHHQSVVGQCKKHSDIQYKEIDSYEEIDSITTQAKWKGSLFLHYENDYLALSPQPCHIYLIKLKSEVTHTTRTVDLFDTHEETISSNSKAFEATKVFAKLENVLKDSSTIKVGYNIKDLFKLSWQNNADLLFYHDVQVMSYILDSVKYKQDLSNIIKYNLLTKFEEDDWSLPFKGKKLNIQEKLVLLEKREKGNKVDQYDEHFIEMLYLKMEGLINLFPILQQRISDEKMSSIYESFERPLTRVLASMENEGISINLIKLKELSETFDKEIRSIEKEIYKLATTEFNIGSPKQLSEVLFEKLSIKSGKKSAKSGQLSTDSKILEELALEGYDIADKVLEWRHFSKLKSTYTDALQREVDPKTHRVHTSFSNVNVVSGRLSSNNPNLQNIPIRSEEGEQIREAFEAKKGYKLVSADYSQVELRVLAHYANVKELIQAFKEDKDIHAITGSKIFGIPESEVKKDFRRKAKAINFGIVYGISAFGLARNLKISHKEASDYINAYFETYPEIKEYMSNTKKFANENGYVKTLFGRKCHIDIKATKFDKSFVERLAINAPIQGTAADIIKKAMIDLYNVLEEKKLDAKILLQVHDELILEVKENIAEDVRKILQDVMENAVKLSVPLKAEAEIGNNWREIH